MPWGIAVLFAVMWAVLGVVDLADGGRLGWGHLALALAWLALGLRDLRRRRRSSAVPADRRVD